LIRLIKGLSDNEEGNMVANSIFEEKMRNQLNNKDIAILYRTNAQSRSMEEALRRKGVPYRIYGGISFYARKEIKDLLSYFRITVNPNDEEALKRIINYPKREIGKTTVDKIIIAADRENLSLWQVIEKINTIETGINAPTRNRISDFVNLIKSFSAMLKTKPAYDLASHIAMSTGLLKELYADKSPEGISHYDNLQELLNGIKEFTDKGTTALPAPSSELEADASLRTLDVFLQDIALVTDGENNELNEDTVSLMTIHSAKGLEFKYVYVVGMEENLFPSQMALQSRAELEEERRLFYVAITRAETKLTLSYAVSRYKWGNLISCEPSRFIAEINPAFIDDQTSVTTKVNSFDRPRNRSDFGNRNSKPEVVHTTPGANFKKVQKLAATTDVSTEPFEADDATSIEVGMEVEHQKFGTGKVENIEGSFPEIKATVVFPGHGSKSLLLKYAKLRIVR